MFPVTPAGLETVHEVKMLAKIGQWEGKSGFYIDHSQVYLLLVLFKLGLDVAFFHLCCQKLFSTYYSLCDISIVLADMLLASLLGLSWYHGGEDAAKSTCLILASASAMFGALPLPIMMLGVLSYSLDVCYPNLSSFWKSVRNAGLVLLAWASTFYLVQGTVSGELIELHTQQDKCQICEVKESRVINYFLLLVFTVIICAMLPFGLKVPTWLRELLERAQETQEYNLLSSTPEVSEREFISSRPPLWLSLMLGFSSFWAPYLVASVISIAFGFGVPAYIVVNVLWIECTNSFLLSLMFYARSGSRGPYCNLPKNVCMWHICWYLSKAPQQSPIDVFTHSKQQKNIVYHV